MSRISMFFVAVIATYLSRKLPFLIFKNTKITPF